MTPEEQERIDIMSKALAHMLRRQEELESRIRFLESTSGFKAPVPTPARSPFPAEATGPHTPTPPPLPPPIIPPPLPPQTEFNEARQHGALSDSTIPPPLEVPPQLEEQVGLTWLNRAGVVTLIFGTAFLFKLGVDNGYIGPGTRVALGIAAAILSLFFGDRMWRRSHVIFSQGLMGLGIALLYLSFYAADTLYGLLPQSGAFALMALTTVGAGYMGLQYESQAIAMLGLLGGYLTPVLLSTGEDHPWILFTYTFALNIGGLALSRARRWMFPEYLSFAATIFLFAGWYVSWFNDANRSVAATFSIAFFAQFAAASSRAIVFVAQFFAAVSAIAVGDKPPQLLILSLIYAAGGLAVAEFRRWRETPSWSLVCFWLPYAVWLASSPHLIARIYNFELLSIGFAMFFAWVVWWSVLCRRELRSTDLTMFVANAAGYWIASMNLLNPIHHELMGYFAVALAVIHGAAASLLSKREDRAPSEFAMAVALAFLTLAIPIQFAGFSITIAWALQASALAWLAFRYKNVKLNIGSWLVFALVIARLFAFDAVIDSGPFGVRFLTFTVAAVALWMAARFAQTGLPAAAPYVIGHFVMLWNLGMEVVGWAGRNATPADLISTETTGVSILMALYAMVLIVIGVATRTVINRVLGLGLMGLVVAKLYLSDVWLLSRIFRITAFLVLGIVLLSVSYLYSRFKPVITRLWKGDES
jgi:hypothetical protein